MNRLQSFLLKKYSLQRAFVYTVVFAFFAPFGFGMVVYGPTPGRWIFAAIFISIVALLYVKLKADELRWNINVIVQSNIAMLPLLAGYEGYRWCFVFHICMGGHMQHPPYPHLHYLVDFGWVLAFLIPAIWLSLIRSPACIAITAISVFIVTYRMLYGSFGGWSFIFL